MTGRAPGLAKEKGGARRTPDAAPVVSARGCGHPQEPVEQEPPQPPPPPRSMAESTLKPMPVKSILMGLASSRNFLSTRKVRPFSLKISSVSRGSSRASDRAGPPQPPGFKNTRTGLFSG